MNPFPDYAREQGCVFQNKKIVIIPECDRHPGDKAYDLHMHWLNTNPGTGEQLEIWWDGRILIQDTIEADTLDS